MLTARSLLPERQAEEFSGHTRTAIDPVVRMILFMSKMLDGAQIFRGHAQRAMINSVITTRNPENRARTK